MGGLVCGFHYFRKRETRSPPPRSRCCRSGKERDKNGKALDRLPALKFPTCPKDAKTLLPLFSFKPLKLCSLQRQRAKNRNKAIGGKQRELPRKPKKHLQFSVSWRSVVLCCVVSGLCSSSAPGKTISISHFLEEAISPVSSGGAIFIRNAVFILRRERPFYFHFHF